MFRTLEEYMVERYRIFLRKEKGEPFPWTEDPILREFKFTNVFRSDDRTTRFLSESFYRPQSKRPLHEILGNAAIFRYFGTVGFAEELGWSESFQRSRILDVARDRKRRGEKNFTGAYMVTNANRPGPKEDVVTDFLEGLWRESEAIAADGLSKNRWADMVASIRKVDGFGGTGFMAKEIALDTMLYGWKPTDRFIWTPFGPGGRRGLNRVMGRPLDTKIPEETMLHELWDIMKRVTAVWPKEFPALTATDIQFNMCEWDKYCRTRDGEGRPRSKYQQR